MSFRTKNVRPEPIPQYLKRQDPSVTTEPRALRIDVHAHYYSDRFIDLIEARGCDCGACIRRDARGPIIDAGPLHAGPLASRFIDLDERVADMDAQGVDIQALSLTQPMVYWAEEALARELSATFNDDLVAAHERYPDRLIGLAMLPMHHAASALAELDRIRAAPGIKGIYMGTAIGDMDLSHESLFSIFEAIEAAGLPIFLHPLKVLGMADRLKPFFLSNLLGNPFDTAVAAAHLIFGGVLDRFPKLDFVLPHAGGALPFLAGRLQHGWRVRPELRHMERGPAEYLGRFYFDTIAHSDDALAYMIEQVGADRVMLGSDYCFDMGFEQPVDVVLRQNELTAVTQQLVLGGTAQKLLRL
jgi:aminocarboxymuconate-semialdehyde decarboxylase